ncbi:MAG TPA: nuclear transport factor 2 family protein [Paucimonas sp.]|nr:nuclear transport factor 2 family protein [Paucimonas sp.]HJW56618.1 nuclear transport factor 2 family protein [Burkholderiaceae bacterium]
MGITRFMENYKKAWETSDENLLASLFTTDGCYRNTPFAVQTGHAQIKEYWQRTKLQQDIRLDFEILHSHAGGGIAHWHTTYQVASEEMFAIWAASNGTNMLARNPGDPLPRLALDGVAVVALEPDGLCREFRIWWHSVIDRQ